MDEQQRVVAAFDFDCTISTRDTLIPFLIFTFGWARSLWGGVMILPYLLGYVAGLCSRKRIKEVLFGHFFGGYDGETFQELADRFSAAKLPTMIRPKARERIEWHKNQGHRLIVVSAAVEYYLRDWAEKNGFEAVVATQLALQDGKITGELSGENCRREEKVNRLKHYLEKETKDYTLYAYGDSIGDKELLEYADFPHYREL